MDIWEHNKLLLFIAFVIPGFIGLKAYELLFPGPPRDSSKQIVDAIAISCFNYALLLWPISAIESGGLRLSNPVAYSAFYVFVLLLAPILWAFAYKWLRLQPAIQRILPHPGNPWDYVFGSLKPYWIVVTLKDGTKLGGKYDNLSFSSTSGTPERLYLEEAWVINDKGGFERKKNNTAGTLIMCHDVTSIEFFHITYPEDDERTEQES
jgi:hypothetical protein